MFPQKQRLPPNDYDDGQGSLHCAYEECLAMESAAKTQDEIVLARCLGYLIRELPFEANEVVANEVVACEADFEKMSILSRLYIDHLIRLFRQSKGPTPTPSEHPSRPSFKSHSTFFSEAVDPAPRNHKNAKKSALRRDNYRCVVTGWADTASLSSMTPADLQKYNLTPDVISTTTNYCHIFPPSTNWDFDPSDPEGRKQKYAGAVWAIIDNFRRINVLTELDGANIHHLGNGFTLDVALHTLFDSLKVWFEQVEGDTYIVRALSSYGALATLPPNPTIMFTSTDPSLPLPNPEYLKLHAAVCRIAHLSGAAGYLDLEDRGIEELGVLSRDGSSADLLASRLRYVELRA